MAVPQPDPMPNPWGLPVVPPSPIPADVEIGLTCDDDEIDGWEPKDDDGMPFGRFLAIFAYVAMTTIRRHAARTRIQYGINRWRI